MQIWNWSIVNSNISESQSYRSTGKILGLWSIWIISLNRFKCNWLPIQIWKKLKLIKMLCFHSIYFKKLQYSKFGKNEKKFWRFWRGSNSRPSACKADVINHYTTEPPVLAEVKNSNQIIDGSACAYTHAYLSLSHFHKEKTTKSTKCKF